MTGISLIKVEDTQATINWKDNYDGNKIIVVREFKSKPIKPVESKKYKPATDFSTISNDCITGAGNVVVYTGKDASGKLSLLKLLPEKDYSLDFYHINLKTNKLEAKSNPSSNKFSTPVAKPKIQAAGINYKSTTDNSMTVNWRNGDGKGRIVIVKEKKAPDKPKNGTSYKPNPVFGKGQKIGDDSYVVYTGTGKSVELKNLKSNTEYFISVLEYNGMGAKISYLDKNIAGNPSSKTTLISTPVVGKPDEFTQSGFLFKWNKVAGAESYLIDVATDKDFKNIAGIFKGLDVGDLADYEVSNLERGKTYFYRVTAINRKNTSAPSKGVEAKIIN